MQPHLMTAEIITRTQVRRERLRREVRLLAAGWRKLSISKDDRLCRKYEQTKSSGIDQVVERAFYFAECNLRPSFPTCDVRHVVDNAMSMLQTITGIDRRTLREMGKCA